MTLARRLGVFLDGAGEDGGVGVQSFVLDQPVIGIFGPGIDGRKRYASRFRNAQQAQITAVFPVVLGFHHHQHAGGAVVPHIIGEQTGIGGASGAGRVVEEMRILLQPHPAADAFLEIAIVAEIVAGQQHGNVVILCNTAHVVVNQTVPDNVNSAVQH